MKSIYRPSFAGIVILAYALLLGVYAVRWTMDGHTADGAGAAVGMLALLLLAWRLDRRML
jgi:hypothetical protein